MRAAIRSFRSTSRRLSALAAAVIIAVMAGARPAAQPSLPGLVFGSSGPGRVAVDAAGNIYVIEGSRVRVFDSSGVPFLVFGSQGSLPGQFESPTDIGVAANGSIYVADSGNFRVQRFTPAGVHDLSFGSRGQGPGQFFNRVMSLALDASGNVYVGSVFQLQKFAPDGTLLQAYQLGGVLPEALAIAGNGDIVMYEKDNGTINVYDNEGTFLHRFSEVGCNIQGGFGCSMDQAGAIEPGDGEMRSGAGALAVDALGNIYLTDSGNHRIQKFRADGTFLWKFGGPGANHGQFGDDTGPQGLAVDASGRLYVADPDNDRIQVFWDDRTITIADRSIAEGDAGVIEAVFTVSLSAPSVTPVSVDFTTVDDGAQAGSDYRSASGTLTFAPGETTATITVLVEGDTVEESDETFEIQLSNPAGAGLADEKAVGTIVNDDDDGGPGDDTTPPSVTYAIDPPPNAAGWNNTPVQLTWTVSDAESGIATTTGCETRQLAADPTDLTITCTATNGDGLSATVTAAVRIDRTPPAISIVSPQSRNYILNEALSAQYSCSDEGSLVGSCIGTAPQGSVMSPGVGTHRFQVNAVDRAGNQSSASVTYTVSYAVCLLYNPSDLRWIGPVTPLWLHLCDANGRNVSSSTVALRAIELVNVRTGAVTRPKSMLTPPDAFRYAPWPGAGSYMFPLITLGMPRGQYELRFRAGDDPTMHVAPFVLR